MEREIDTEPQTADPRSAPAPERHWGRLAYIAEFLLAMLTVAIVWNEVGGDAMDIMPWYAEIAALLAFSWSVVRFSMALVEQPAVWSLRSLRWAVAMLLIGCAMVAVTCYYHLHQPVDDSDQEDQFSTSMWVTPAAGYRSNVV